MAKNKTFYVEVTSTITRGFTVKAKDEEEAKEKAMKLDSSKAEETEETMDDATAEEVEDD